jgi:starch phosphorylase
MFLRDYNMLQAQHLVQGCDLWINTPLRPWEACGTSGMKILANGGLNLSELDGWWAEAYAPDVGWAIGDGKEHDGGPAIDAADAEALYKLLEQEVIPEFYDRNRMGIPVRWVARLRESMARLTPQFSANRAVREYTEKYYLPAATAFIERAAVRERTGLDLLQWQQDIARLWPHVHFGAVEDETRAGVRHVSVQVYLGELPPDQVKVQLYAEHKDTAATEIIAMARQSALIGAGGGYLYTASIPAQRLASDYTARLIPFHGLAAVPLEATEILWQR